MIGSSPRGRGTLFVTCKTHANERFIPAWAGNSLTAVRTNSQATVHPRVGGELFGQIDNAPIIVGSSPRGRGTRFVRRLPIRLIRFIPAWAGNSRCRDISVAQSAVHPRVGGELLPLVFQRHGRVGSSPRGRGTRGRVDTLPSNLRFIPAWAGNSQRQRSSLGRSTVHPRVGGELGFGRNCAGN